MLYPQGNINQLTDHLFRHESGKMVAVLTNIFGVENLQVAEDVVQDTLLHALQVWPFKGVPANPSGWLFYVARNKAIDVIRRNNHLNRFDVGEMEQRFLAAAYTQWGSVEGVIKEEPVEDDMLRMMFACCHPDIAEESQIALILKTLCGFSTAEIAKAFLIPEDTISKRLYRTKEFFRRQRIPLVIPSISELKNRTQAVLHSIYLLFNEGYNSTHAEELIRKDLIEDAIRLCRLLAENPHTQQPETFALMALMCFHTSRTDSRLTPAGEMVLLSHQDRSKWNKTLIMEGDEWMQRAAYGEMLTAYHLEAAIAFEHCTAPNFNTTNWERILQYYEYLCHIVPSPVTELNKAVVILQANGPAAALSAVENIQGGKQLESFYLYHSLLGEIYAQLSIYHKARESFATAGRLTRSETEKKLLREKASLLPG